MHVGDFYIHPENSSVCIKVLKYFHIPEGDRASVKVEWHRCNKAGKILYNMHIREYFEMPVTYWREWKLLKVGCQCQI